MSVQVSSERTTWNVGTRKETPSLFLLLVLVLFASGHIVCGTLLLSGRLCLSAERELSMLLCLAVLGVVARVASAFVLDGSPTSYAQFRKWNPGLNGTLEFEFKTNQPNGLLLYTDDGGTYDFIEIKLVEGACRIRFNLGGGAKIMAIGENLNDGHWHKVRVKRMVERTSLEVDRSMIMGTSRGKEFYFGNLATNSDVFFGGMPPYYNSKLTLLALPSVIFELRFMGAIRNVVYADEHSAVPRRQEMVVKNYKCAGSRCSRIKGKHKVTRSNATDACEEYDPCQHEGICISTDTGPICECRNNDYEGTFCEKGKSPSEATFLGSEFLSYDLNTTGGVPIVSSQDTISLSFKTRYPNGLLYFTGHGESYLNIALRQGSIVLKMGMGNEKLEMNIRPHKIRFDDNQWHSISVHRKVQLIIPYIGTSFCRLTLTVDGTYSDHSHLHGHFSMLYSSQVYVGGSPSVQELPGSSVPNNFTGCLRKVEFTADTLKINLIDLGRTGSKFLTVVGHMEFKCHERKLEDPVQFLDKDAHLVLPNWDAKKSGTLAFKFRTVEDTSLFMFSRGSGTTQPDFFGFEMIEGQMFLHLDLGSGHTKIRITTRRINDGAWHEVNLRRNGKEGRVTVDDMMADFATPGDSALLELDGGLYIGGVGNPLAPVDVPVYFWTGVLRMGFVGCMRDLIVNGNAIDIAGYARQQDTTSIRASCHVQPGQCDSQPCLNGGICRDGWNRFTCDCSATNYGGPICGKEAATASFNGSQYITIGLAEGTKTQAEDLTLRFKTFKKDGMIFSTNNDHFGDKLELSIQGGKLKMCFRIGGLEKTITTGQNLQDYTWHVIKFNRRGNFFYLKLDNYPIIRAERDLDKESILEYNTLYLGCYPTIVNKAHKVEGFGGVIQQFTFNGFPWLERLSIPYRINQIRAYPNVNVTARFLKRYDSAPYRTITFRSKHTFVGLPTLKAFSATNIFFQFKTREANGLILYNGGKGLDFIAVELVNGHIHFLFNLGDKTVRVRDNAKVFLNDNKWHSVAIGRPRIKQHTLQVDDTFVIVTNVGHHEDLDLNNLLYIGGVKKEAYKSLPKQIQSRHGYEGCLGSLDLNGESPNIVIEALIPSNQIVKGCEEMGTKCDKRLCENRGHCVQQWNSFECDCETTSFTGPTCSDESTSYEFGPTGGMIWFSVPENRQVETKADVLTLGFITTKDNAIILRVESATTSDYIQMEIVEGNVLVLYYLGTHENPISETGVKVDDDSYHVIRYTRSGPNATLQIDDYNIQSYNPAGPQLSVFNTQGKIFIGGKWDPGSHSIERPFVGVLSGFVFNGQRILDLAAEKDARITTVGDVHLLSSLSSRIHVPPPTMQQTPASNLPGLMDDLVYSGAGSGCQNDDEDQCLPVFDTGSGDDLITPVYIPPTRSPSTTKPSGSKGGNENQSSKPCDDEDCFDGSGNGEPTTENTSSGLSQGSTTITGSSTSEEATKGSTTMTDSSTSSLAPETSSTKTTTTMRGTITSSTQMTTRVFKTTFGMITTSSTTTTTEYLDLPQPIPPWSSSRPPFSKKRDRISSESAENTALVIGIIAGTMIAIILIILIILRFKHKSAASYKADESKCYQQSQGPNAALLPAASSLQFEQNGNLKNGNGSGKNLRKQKDVKEWYV